MARRAWHSLGLATLALVAGIGSTQAMAQDASAAAADAESRYQQLAPLAAQRAGDPAFDYALGLAALDSGRHGEAIIALQRVLARQPNHAEARAELARAYAMAGDIDTARAQFATVVDDPSLPDPVRRRFTGFVRQFDRQIAGGGSDVSGFVDLQGGWDSNINSATDLTSITIPLFSFLGPGTLGAGARAQDDEFAEASAGVSAVTAVGRQDRLFASVLGNWREIIGDGRFDQQGITGTAGYAHTFANRDVVSVSAQAQRFFLGGDGYRTAVGGVAQYTHLLPQGRALTLSAQYNRLNFDGQPILDADRYAVAVGFVTRTLSASVTGGHEETRQNAGDAYSHDFATASIGAELPLGPKLAVVGGASFDLRRYDAPDALFLTERKDERLDLQAGLKIALSDQVFLQPRASYTRNWSNIALYDYDRWTVSAGVRFEF